MIRLLLALLLAVLALPLAACALPGSSSTPADGVAYVFSAGEWVLRGHNHPDLLLRSEGSCDGCQAWTINLADMPAQQRAEEAALVVLNRFVQPGFVQLDQRLKKLEAAVAALSTTTGGDR